MVAQLGKGFELAVKESSSIALGNNVYVYYYGDSSGDDLAYYDNNLVTIIEKTPKLAETTEQNQSTQPSVTQPAIEVKSNIELETEETFEAAASNQQKEYLQKLKNIENWLVDLEYLYKNGITSEMTEAESETYKRWDDALNEIYGALKDQLSRDEMNKLREEQRQWIANRDNTAEAESLEFKGGTMESLQYISTQARLTKERCFKLVQDYMQ
jgi:uncharacterized protein YecT (DUF1311 family)